MCAIVRLDGGSIKQLQFAWMNVKNFATMSGSQAGVTEPGHCSLGDQNVAAQKVLLFYRYIIHKNF